MGLWRQTSVLPLDDLPSSPTDRCVLTCLLVTLQPAPGPHGLWVPFRVTLLLPAPATLGPGAVHFNLEPLFSGPRWNFQASPGGLCPTAPSPTVCAHKHAPETGLAGLRDTGRTRGPPGGLQVLQDRVFSGRTRPSPELGLTGLQLMLLRGCVGSCFSGVGEHRLSPRVSRASPAGLCRASSWVFAAGIVQLRGMAQDSGWSHSTWLVLTLPDASHGGLQ